MKKDKTARSMEWKNAFKKKLKGLTGSLVLLLIILVGVMVIVFWQDVEEPEEIIKVNGYEGEEKKIVLENSKLIFEMDSETTQFSITMKNNGQTWYSNPQNISEDALASGSEKDKLNSTLLLTYSTINGVDTLYNNYTYSMENKIYQIEEGEDYVKVDYSIGDVEKEYVIPLVIEEDRMQAVVDKLDNKAQMTISDYYKKYDINHLAKKDNKEELLARYPILEQKVIYALRDTAKENMKKKLEEIFAGAGYTYEEYQEDKEKDKATKSSGKPIFNISVIYRLEGDDLLVEIPYDEIEYKEDYPIYSLSILPYFGASGTKEKGFLFVPEGGGAIIDFNNGKTAQSSYFANVYGWDMAQDRDAVVHETKTSFNVFGEAKEGASFICILEEGAPYAAIQADISGRNNSYNYVSAVYSIVHREQYDVSDKFNGNMFVYEPNLPNGESLVQRYRFVDSGDYVDMAIAYRDYLTSRYSGYLTRNDDTQVPVAIEIVGAADKVKQVLGVPVSRPLELTTFEEAEDIICKLQEDGLQNMSVKVTGWMNGGVQQKLLSTVKPVKELGSKNELQNLIDKSEELGIAIYLDGITSYAYDSNLLNGFFVYTDAARFVSKEKAELYEYSTVTYAKRESQDTYYLLRNDVIQKMMDNLTKAAVAKGAGVSFRDIGSELSSDFYRKAPVSRQAAMESQVAKLQEACDNGTEIMLNTGNDYAIPYCSMITNMDLSGSEYTLIDHKIPFYQIAIHGYLNYTGEALNLTQNGEEELLKSAEYGAGLSFTLMDESAFSLQNTLYTRYFGADFNAWHDRLVEIYERYSREMGHVFGQMMIDHEYLTENLTCTVYEDGTRVYVNYAYENMVTDDGIDIPARDYVVVK